MAGLDEIGIRKARSARRPACREVGGAPLGGATISRAVAGIKQTRAPRRLRSPVLFPARCAAGPLEKF
jgi:hypothetical protein